MLFWHKKNKVKDDVKPEPKPKQPVIKDTKKFIVVSMEDYNKTIKNLLSESEYYPESKKDLLDIWEVGKHVYKYYENYPCDLVLDANGQYKVLVYDECVGYLKKGNTSQIKNLINGDFNIKISAVVYGGKYKFWEEWRNGDLVYDTNDCDIIIKVIIDIYHPQEN